MRPKQIHAALNVAIDIQRPVFIWGPPGIGKSDIVAAVARERDMDLRDVRLNLLDPTDIKGFPVPDVAKGQMEWLPADFLPHMLIEKDVLVDSKGMRLIEDGDALHYEDGTLYKGKTQPKHETRMVPNDTKGILFLDELNQAPPMVQAASYQLLLTRKVGNYTLPPGWSILAAGNRETDRSNAQRMPAALSLRLIHLDMESHPDDWCEWALNNAAQAPVELLTFIRFRPDLLHNFDPARRVSPNPRSWTFCGQLINSGLDPEVEFEMMKGSVGEAEAGEFKAYLGVWKDMPSVDQVKLDPDGTVIPENAAAMFAITGALAAATTKDVYPRFKRYIDRMDAEWQVVYTKDAMVHDRAITTTKEFQQFAVKHSHLLA